MPKPKPKRAPYGAKKLTKIAEEQHNTLLKLLDGQLKIEQRIEILLSHVGLLQADLAEVKKRIAHLEMACHMEGG